MRSDLLSSHSLVYGFSAVADGNIDFRFGPATQVTATRKAFLERLGTTPADCVTMRVQGADKLKVVGKSERGRGMQSIDDAPVVDGLFTSERRLGLSLSIADCLPIILYDPNGALGLVHAGWKGTDLRIVQQAVRLMDKQFASRPENLLAYIGPGIGAASYTFRDPVQASDPEWRPFLEQLPNGETTIDLAGFNRQQLIKAGLTESNIELSNVDTAQDARYFSHYRATRTNQPEARFMAAAMLP